MAIFNPNNMDCVLIAVRELLPQWDLLPVFSCPIETDNVRLSVISTAECGAPLLDSIQQTV